MSARCRSCGAAIIWAKTCGGKRMPVDAAPSADGNLVLIESAQFTEVSVVSEVSPFPGRDRHKSHFATCPNAPQHRKPRP